ncbi:MAG: exo-alpha-sialidase [Planctomycetota bacterium]
MPSGFVHRLPRSCTAFVALLLLTASAAASAQRPTCIAVVGDGAALAREGLVAPWPVRLEASRIVDIPVVTNLARSGQTVREAREALAAHDREETVDVVVLQFGIDAADLLDDAAPISAQVFGAELEELVQSIRARDARTPIVLLTPTPLDGERSNEAHAEQVRAVARATGSCLVDLHRTFGRRKRFAGHAATDWLAEGRYPNQRGHEVIEHLVARAIVCSDLFLPDAAHTWRPEWADPNRWPGRPDYSIPVLDLSADSARQVTVDRESGQYLGHPTTVLLEDGRTLLAVYPKGHGGGGIVMKRSTDGGLTWSERCATPASWASSREVPTIHRVVDAAGTRRLVLFSGLYPIRMSVSEDDGLHWTELAPIGAFGGIVAMSSVLETKTPGRYLALFHDDGRFLTSEPRKQARTRFTVYQSESLDGGLTWSAPRAIVESELQHCEPGALRSPDGKTLAVLLRENSRVANSHVIFSTDEGASWTAPRPLPASLTGDRHVARYAPDGRLFVTFRDQTLVSPTSGDWVAWVGTWDDLVRGTEGQYRVRLMDNLKDADCAYPGLELLPDGTFVTTTYGHWTRDEAPYVVSVRLRLAELDALALEPGELR